MPLRKRSYRVSATPRNSLSRAGRTRAWMRLSAPLVLVVGALLLVWTTSRMEIASASPYPVERSTAFDPLLASYDRSGDLVSPLTGPAPLEVPFRSGQTVGDVLALLNLEPPEAQLVVDELAKLADLRRIRPRDRYAAISSPASGLETFVLTLDGRGRAAVARQDGRWEGSWVPFERRTSVERISGRLEESLEQAIRDAGGEASLAYLMADVLQWDLDFTRDLRVGDTFEVLYETVHLDGSYYALGDVVALSYDNMGRRLEAYRHGTGAAPGHYDAEGRPLRKMFLRSPMRYSRVTSRFSGRRFHPVLKRYRPHYGVDYGAPTGTPVRVTAGGVVTSAGWDGGGGRTVKVRHPNGYLTAYLHLSKFAESIRSGRRVSQGDVIGYVGSSGLASGPHLDYRVKQNGRWIDPLSIKSVPADPVPREDMEAFVTARDRMRRSLWEGAPWEATVDEPIGEFTVAAAGTDVSGGS